MCMLYDTMRITMFTLLVVLLSLIVGTDGLIGLRPARQDPRYREKEPQLHGVHTGSNQTSANNVSNLQSTHELKLFVNFTDHSSCHPVPLLRCTYRFLRQSLNNESIICQRINSFIKCAANVLKSEGRRSFIFGLSTLTDLSSEAQIYHGCEVISSTHVSSGHTRHERTKRSSSQCCTNELLHCAAQSVIKLMTISRSQQCHILSFYNSCVRTFEDLCDSRTVLTTFEILRLQLQKSCWKR